MSNTPIADLVYPAPPLSNLATDRLPALADRSPAVVTNGATPYTAKIEHRYPFQQFINQRQKLVDMLNSNSDLAMTNNKQIDDARKHGADPRVVWMQLASRLAGSVGVSSDADAVRKFAISVADEQVGLAGLEDLIRDPSIMNITVTWERDSAPSVRIHHTDNTFEDLSIHLATSWSTYRDTIIGRAITFAHKQTSLSMSNPYVEMVLKDYNARFVTSITPDGETIYSSMRLNRVGDPTLMDLYKLRVVPSIDIVKFLAAACAADCNVLFAGPQQSGKTTILRGYINEVPPDEEIMIVEDIPELHMSRDRHHVMLSFEASEQAPMRITITRAMRFVVRRIFVGEALDSAILNWIFASMRLRGSACTVHAESIEKVFEAVVGLTTINTGGDPPEPREVVLRKIADAVDFIVFMEAEESPDDASKFFPTVKGIMAVDNQVSTSGVPKNNMLWEWDAKSRSLVWSGNSLPEHIAKRWDKIGVRLDNIGGKPNFVITQGGKTPAHLLATLDSTTYTKQALHNDPMSAYHEEARV